MFIVTTDRFNALKSLEKRTDGYCDNNNLTHLELPNATYVHCRNNNLKHIELPNATEQQQFNTFRKRNYV